MRKMLFAVVVLTLLGFLTGCYPRATVTRYGVKGRLVDAQTKQAITDAPLTVVVDEIKFTLRTNGKGDFQAPSEVYWNWNRFISGPMYTSAEQATIRVQSSGYQPFDITLLSAPPLNPSDEIIGNISGSYMLLGDVELQRE